MILVKRSILSILASTLAQDELNTWKCGSRIVAIHLGNRLVAVGIFTDFVGLKVSSVLTFLLFVGKGNIIRMLHPGAELFSRHISIVPNRNVGILCQLGKFTGRKQRNGQCIGRSVISNRVVGRRCPCGSGIALASRDNNAGCPVVSIRFTLCGRGEIESNACGQHVFDNIITVNASTQLRTIRTSVDSQLIIDGIDHINRGVLFTRSACVTFNIFT